MKINVLIPTYNRLKALGITLTSLYFQTFTNFNIIIADQSDNNGLLQDQSLQTLIFLLQKKGHEVKVCKNLPPRGMAQQRQFLLDQVTAPYCLYLDDDLVLDNYVIGNMLHVLEKEKIGFVGCAVIGMSYQNDVRPHQQHIELWNGSVQPETVKPKTPEWERYKLHNAANLLHVQEKFKASPDNPITYKVAWVGGCVLYDTEKLKDVGGFNFWNELPEKHCGEDVLAQLRVMKKYGGCGIMPSGVYHQELETTIPDRKTNAPEVLEI